VAWETPEGSPVFGASATLRPCPGIEGSQDPLPACYNLRALDSVADNSTASGIWAYPGLQMLRESRDDVALPRRNESEELTPAATDAGLDMLAAATYPLTPQATSPNTFSRNSFPELHKVFMTSSGAPLPPSAGLTTLGFSAHLSGPASPFLGLSMLSPKRNSDPQPQATMTGRGMFSAMHKMVLQQMQPRTPPSLQNLTGLRTLHSTGSTSAGRMLHPANSQEDIDDPLALLRGSGLQALWQAMQYMGPSNFKAVHYLWARLPTPEFPKKGPVPASKPSRRTSASSNGGLTLKSVKTTSPVPVAHPGLQNSILNRKDSSGSLASLGSAASAVAMKQFKRS